TVTARVNAIKASLPNPDSASQSQVPSSFHGAIPAPIVEAALGLLRGRGGFLSVDALGSAVLLPTSGVSGLSVDSNAAHIGGAALGIGYGARVGILSGTFPIPALSVSWMHRTLPRIQYGKLGPAFGTGDQFEFSMDLKADNYRAVASWKFVLLDLAAGLGIDHYGSSQTTVRFYDGVSPTARTVVVNPSNTREVLFAHHGKTPPCTEALIAAGVTRVVAAIRDPDPAAHGGAEVLRAKGLAVTFGVLAERAAALNAPFLFAHAQAERPFVALKLATSIDGRIADAPGSSRWVSGEAAREYVHWLRAGFDAIAGGGT